MEEDTLPGAVKLPQAIDTLSQARESIEGLPSSEVKGGSVISRAQPIDQERIQRAVREILEAIGEDPEREGLRHTPGRIARMYAEVFSGSEEQALQQLAVGFRESHSEMILIRNIAFHSICEHHLLPFSGCAHVAYIPRGKIVGLSKIARTVDILARRPQIQERLTSLIADVLERGLDPVGVAVVVEAEHLCMVMRGVKKPGSFVTTSALRGGFRTNPATRAEFFSLVASGRERL
ncbi:MAG: GTP cyclohydrolase I FolE [bacterium]